MITRIARCYFAQGDTKIFQYIKFDYKTPVSVDKPILQFIKHVESQPTANWVDTPQAKPEELPVRPPLLADVPEPAYVQ